MKHGNAVTYSRCLDCLPGSRLLLGYRNGYVSICDDVEKAAPEFSPLHHHGRQVTGLALVHSNHS